MEDTTGLIRPVGSVGPRPSVIRDSPRDPTPATAGSSPAPAISRRSFLRGLALGGAVIAGELWIPGQKLISIPKSTFTPIWTGISKPVLPDEIGRMYAEALARSIRQTRLIVAQNVLERMFSDG